MKHFAGKCAVITGGGATRGVQQPIESGPTVARGLERGEFPILAHAAGWDEIETRFTRLREAFERRPAWD